LTSQGDVKVAIVQPSYLPWKGFFDIIFQVDCFVFLDDVQYTVRDWRSRNKIKQRDGSTRWITVPVLGGRNQRIADVKIDRSQPWERKHLEALRHAYAQTPFFDRYFSTLSDILRSGETSLSRLDATLTRAICAWLGLDRRFVFASELAASGSKDDHLIEIVKKVGGTAYLSGPSARDYIRPGRFAEEGIALSYVDYSGYPEYTQTSAPFVHAVTVLDLLFAVGPEAPDYIWGARRLRSAKKATETVDT
jgi:hypothetical protein